MQHRVLVVILGSLAMMGTMSIDAYLPAIPAIAHDFHATLPAVQQTLTIYLITFAFMSLFFGTLSDSFGRRPVILVSLVFYLASSIGAAFAPSLAWLLVFRFLQGLCAGSGSVIGRAMIGDLFSGAEAQKIMSYVSTIFGLAPAIAPILCGWILAHSDWRSIFYFICAYSFLLLIACYFWLPESLAENKRHDFHFGQIVRRYIEVGSHTRFMCRTAAGALAFSGIMLYVAAAPAYIINLLHLTVKDFGWLFVSFIGGMTFGSMASGQLSHRIRPATIIRVGYLIMAFSMVASLVYTAFFEIRVPWAVIPHFFYGFGAAIATPAMTVITLEMFPKVKGLPSSMQSFVFLVIFTVIAGCIVPLLFSSAFLLAIGSCVGFGFSVLCWWIGSRGEKEHPILTKEEDELAQEAPHLQ
jgi:DHA1 family bicyclomycin/chloramphenicol resistance-like MFS transporter